MEIIHGYTGCFCRCNTRDFNRKVKLLLKIALRILRNLGLPIWKILYYNTNGTTSAQGQRHIQDLSFETIP